MTYISSCWIRRGQNGLRSDAIDINDDGVKILITGQYCLVNGLFKLETDSALSEKLETALIITFFKNVSVRGGRRIIRLLYILFLKYAHF
jgi:hypothetical protein